jgi:5-methylcytosine-specific restriction endonuclease McrA
MHLSSEPLCRMCSRLGKITPANTVDHISPHKGSWVLFTTPSNLQSLCSSCHSGPKQFIEKRGYSKEVGRDGWPIDPLHPANKKK